MGWGNLPDDWGCYYTHCDLCGRRYHMSEGGCDCTEELDDCACGKRQWERRTGVFLRDDDAPIRCSSCGTEPGATPDEVDDED